MSTGTPITFMEKMETTPSLAEPILNRTGSTSLEAVATIPSMQKAEEIISMVSQVETPSSVEMATTLSMAVQALTL